VATGEKADQQLVGRLALADDHLAQLALDPTPALVDLLYDQSLVLEDIDAVRHGCSLVMINER
jgi:hypothetical protein